MALETLAPSTDRRFGSRADRIDWGTEDEPVAPDTIREHDELFSGTVPLPAISADTAPLAAPVASAASVASSPPVVTEPLAMPAHARPTLSYEIYAPDDTLRGKPALNADGLEDKPRRIALGVLALAVALVTTLAGIGSCEESPTGRVETTSATIAPPPRTIALPAPAPPAAAAAPAVTAANATASAVDNATPPITFSPPLAPVPSAPRRRAVPHPFPKRIP